MAFLIRKILAPVQMGVLNNEASENPWKNRQINLTTYFNT